MTTGTTTIPLAPPRPSWLQPLRAAAIFAASLLLVAVTGSVYLAERGRSYRPLEVPNESSRAFDASSDLGRLQSRLAAASPRGRYLVIDTYRGELRIYDHHRLLRRAVVSSGSGDVLRDPRSGRLWVFDTPLGERHVLRKVRNPVWIKPDWAYVEEGMEPPPPGHRDRLDTVSLGDYALYLGDGYIIHGTLFQTLLGQSVTHGCIRVGDEDLAYVYETTPLGTPVLLY